MLINSFDELNSHIKELKTSCPSPIPNKVLMVKPDYYDVAYAINPYMKDSTGQLQKINRPLALDQWKQLYNKYLELGFEVNVLEAGEGFPDMVFCANQSLPFLKKGTLRPAVIMSQMRSKQRQGEVALVEAWYRKNNYEVIHLKNKSKSIEGNGDALLHPNRSILWGGYGPRTEREVYTEVSEIINYDVILLKLIDPNFYHLDTCFSILNESTVVIQPEAFTPDAIKMIRALFNNVIETTGDECAMYFTGNCHSPNGQDVILQKGCPGFETKLTNLGFRVHALDTSEFLKSGGSVFCMKMMYY